jgi:hypothetical protein
LQIDKFARKSHNATIEHQIPRETAMPALRDPRREAFAQARARGALLIDAYESAGFVRHRGHPSRLALKDEVAERIAELRATQSDLNDVSPAGLLASLRRIIKAGESSENPALVNAARLAIVDASRIQAELTRHQAHEREHLDWVFNDLRAREAAEAAARAAAERPSPPREAPLSAPPAPHGLPAAAPPAPRGLPASAPRAHHNLLASATASPLALPGVLALRPPPSRPPLSGLPGALGSAPLPRSIFQRPSQAARSA